MKTIHVWASVGQGAERRATITVLDDATIDEILEEAHEWAMDVLTYGIVEDAVPNAIEEPT